jgi:glyoxylase I family protein
MSEAAMPPHRLHHHAFVTRDMEATRAFYEDVIGMPLVATWCEKARLFGAERVYCHCFFGLQDGGALAFFQFVGSEAQDLFGPEMPPTPFRHIALLVERDQQDAILRRVREAGYREPERYYVHEHGYCHSLYVKDPNDLIVEFTVDHPDVARINAEQRSKARSELARWLAGDHTPNNQVEDREAG